MNRRIPLISHSRKLCIICEGSEEAEYLTRLKGLGVWNPKYQVILENAEGNGNIAARYQDAYQSGMYDAVFAFVDTDRKPYEQYYDIKRKIDDIYGIEGASNHVVIFANPCTMQIILLHFDEVKLRTHKKSDNRVLIKAYTGIIDYNAKKEKRDSLFRLLTHENFKLMRERLSKLSMNDAEKNSSNFKRLMEWLCDEDEAWLDTLDADLNG